MAGDGHTKEKSLVSNGGSDRARVPDLEVKTAEGFGGLESLDTFKSDDATPLPPKRSHENSKSNIGEGFGPPKPESGSDKSLGLRKSGISARSEHLSVQNSGARSHASHHSNRSNAKSHSALSPVLQPTIDIPIQAFNIQTGVNSARNSGPKVKPPQINLCLSVSSKSQTKSPKSQIDSSSSLSNSIKSKKSKKPASNPRQTPQNDFPSEVQIAILEETKRIQAKKLITKLAIRRSMTQEDDWKVHSIRNEKDRMNTQKQTHIQREISELNKQKDD